MYFPFEQSNIPTLGGPLSAALQDFKVVGSIGTSKIGILHQ